MSEKVTQENIFVKMLKKITHVMLDSGIYMLNVRSKF